MAVLRYGGTWSAERYAKIEAALLAIVREEGLEVIGEPVWARYNGPMTPWFMRRNEVMVEVADPRLTVGGPGRARIANRESQTAGKTCRRLAN